jgi:hypothetical protein
VAALPTTHSLGRFVELGELPRQRDGLGTDNLLLVLFKSVGGATDTTIRNCATYADLLTAGLVVCDFTGYAAKVLGPADRTIGTVTGSSPYKNTVTVAQQTWNPAGGAVNNNPVKSALLYRPDPSTAIGLCRVLGTCDASGAASGGTYSHTFGVMTDQAT